MEIKPFRAWRFNEQVVGEPGSCIAPPYDVIDDSLQSRLYAAGRYNIVRAIRGRSKADDDADSNVYTRAAQYLDAVVSDGALVRDKKELLYAYVQDFEIGGTHYRRSGVIGLGRLEASDSNVRPHEKTLEGPKTDRMRLTRATAAQFGQIFMLYDDPGKKAETLMEKASAGHTLLDWVDFEGVRHRLYAMDGQDSIKQMQKLLSGRQTIIADGHHRYETGLDYWRRTGHPDTQYLMMTFVNMRNEGLIIQPTHRLIAGVEGFCLKKLLDELYEFEISVLAFADAASKTSAREAMFEKMRQCGSAGENIFGIYAADGAFYTARLKDIKSMESNGAGLSEAVRGLDVNVLHTLILEKHLGIGETQLAEQSHIEYIKDIGDAIDRSIGKVDGGDCQAVFFVNPTRIEQVQAAAGAGEKMPQKSTFFYPKLFSGVTINILSTPRMNPYDNSSLTVNAGKE